MNLPAITLPKVKEGQDLSKPFSLAAPAGGIVISVLILLLIIWPKINEILELKTSNEQLVGRAENLENKAEILASLNHNLLEEQLVAAEQMLPSDKSIFPVLRQIEETANSTGVLLNKLEAIAGTINEGSAVSAPAVRSAGPTIAPSVQVRLSTTSDYQSLIRFLAGLYSFSRIVSIDSLSISVGVGEAIQLRTNFTVNAHWKNLPEDLGSIEAPVNKLTAREEELLAKVSSPEIAETLPVPEVPKGRGDPFTPF